MKADRHFLRIKALVSHTDRKHKAISNNGRRNVTALFTRYFNVLNDKTTLYHVSKVDMIWIINKAST